MESVALVARRKKLVAAIISGALAITIMVVALAYWRNIAGQKGPQVPPAPVPTNVHQQLSGYSFTRSDEGRQIFTVHAARTVAFKQGGATVLEDVYVEVFGKSGARRDVLRTRRCEYNQQSGDLFSAGTVQIELNAPPDDTPRSNPEAQRSVMLETSKLYFRQQGSLVMSDEPVRYRIGPVAGTARGMSYATREGWLELKQDVSADLRLKGETESQPPVHLTATHARYDKERSEVALAGPVSITQSERNIVAGSAIVSLDNRNRITRTVFNDRARALAVSGPARLEGSSETIRGDFDPASEELRTVVAEGDVRFESKRPGNLTRLAAQRAEVSFVGEHPEAQKGAAAGNVKLEIESALTGGGKSSGNVSAEKKELTAAGVGFTFQSHGQSLKDAETTGPGKLVVTPADAKVGARVITAGQFLMLFDGRNRLENLRGLSGTRVVFQPAKNAPPGSVAQETTAEHLEANFDTATQTVRTVRQWGNFQFREGDRQGTADVASYNAGTESVTLTGRPELSDPDMRTRSERVLINLRDDSAEGIGKVQSTHLRSNAGATSVLADRVVAQRKNQTVHYEGNVRAWRGTDVIESAALDVYRNERRLSSGYKVRTSHLQPASLVAGGPAENQGRHETRPVTIRADRLEYFDQGRKATYRGNVTLQTEETTLEADRLDAYFSGTAGSETTELERANAEGHVRVTQPGRRAAGDHGEYYAQDGRILLRGGPPTLYDTDKGFTTGQRLTFYIRDDRLEVDGGDESPTLSKHRIAQ
ncbi:MAG: LPS export ABC transporter periplasmic protein LptC [Terriglobia bacterium]